MEAKHQNFLQSKEIERREKIQAQGCYNCDRISMIVGGP